MMKLIKKAQKGTNLTIGQNPQLLAKQDNQREANIANAYFSSTPSIGNLVQGVMHWWDSKPQLGGKTGYITGVVPQVGRLAKLGDKDLIVTEAAKYAKQYPQDKNKIFQAAHDAIKKIWNGNWSLKTVSNKIKDEMNWVGLKEPTKRISTNKVIRARNSGGNSVNYGLQDRINNSFKMEGY